MSINLSLEVEEVNGILNLLNQMTTFEIDMIFNKEYSFDCLWKFYWSGNDIIDKDFKSEINDNMTEYEKIQTLIKENMHIKKDSHLNEYINSKKYVKIICKYHGPFK